MRLAKFKKKEIFCIESDWSHDLRKKNSIKSALDFLELNAGIKNIHRHCSTAIDVKDKLDEYCLKRYDKYGILYFACHGSEGKLHIGKRGKLSLDELAEMIDGRAHKKIIHFGSCETLNLKRPEITRFLKKTDALAISGYTETIDFIDSTLLDILFFEMCQHFQKMAAIEKRMRDNHYGMMRNNGFKIVYEK